MTQHHVPYSTSEKLKRFDEAVGPNKLFGTGQGVIRAFRLMARAEKHGGLPADSYVTEILDVMQEGISVALEDSFNDD